ncbi:MAG: type VI secretion system membrane subunit TssM [Gammaproteobacteria bacterium]|nr:type VI secretion system membrane subunit TssM [Gammaproteobacteria bacterium]
MKKQQTEKLDDLINKLHQRFDGAVHFLKETAISSQDTRTKLFSLPWFLILGLPESGKTSMLANARIDYVLSKKNHLEKQRATHCEWWATRDAIFLDVNNIYTLQTRKTRRERKLWFDFISLLRAGRRSHPFQGLVFCIDIEKLCSTHKNERQAYFHSIRGRIKELTSSTRHAFPVYFVVTKLDKLAGFNEFFDDLTKEEALQLWGITFAQTQTQSAQVMADAFDLEFDQLLMRLNQQLIGRLHHERNLDKRAVIKDFPLQMESVKKPLAAFLQNIADLTSSNQLPQLRGIYLCAAHAQLSGSLDRLAQPLSQAFSVQTYAPEAEIPSHRPYFTRGIFGQLVNDRALVLTHKAQHKTKIGQYLQWSAGIVSLILAITLLAYWVKGFSNNIADLNAIEQAMAQYQVLLSNDEPLNPHQLISQLTKLSAASHNAQQAQVAWFMRAFLPHDAAVYSHASQVFQQTVQLTIAKQLQAALKQQLSKGNNINASTLYLDLRAYLMLGSPHHFDLNTLLTALDTTWSSALDVSQRSQLHFFIMKALVTPPNMALNEDLIKQARFVLAALPKNALAGALLSASYPSQDNLTLSLPQGTSGPVFKSPQTSMTVPAVFTANRFASVYDTLAPQIANSLINGDWVLRVVPSALPITAQDIEDVRQFYIASYIATWQALLANLQLNAFTSYDQAIDTLSAFTRPNSPLLQLIYEIVLNTNVNYHQAPTPISLEFAGFNQSTNQVLAANHDNFIQLINYLQEIKRDQDPANAAFALARAHSLLPTGQVDVFDALNKQIAQLPYPYNNWLNQINQFSLQLILNDAQKAVDQAWQQTVYVEFSKSIAPFYPFTQNTKQNLSLSDFSHFFAPNGTLNTFIAFYLLPFVDTRPSGWILKSFNGASLPLTTQILSQIQEAQNVTRAFFPDSSQQVNLAFIIKPVQLSANIKQIDLSIDNQSAEYSDSFMLGTRFIFSAKNNLHYVAMVLTQKDAKQVNVSLSGPWSFFQWLDTLSQQADPSKWQYTNQNDGDAFTLEITSENQENAFPAKLLHGMTLPAFL